jgi:hypothetical protein
MVARRLLYERPMEGIDTDRNHWMDKITRALQGLRHASQREAEAMQAQRSLAECNDREDPRGR